jgi:hypothetical protein
VRLALADDVGLVADRLVVDQDAVLDEIPALGRHALVVIADRAEAAGWVLSANRVTLSLPYWNFASRLSSVAKLVPAKLAS